MFQCCRETGLLMGSSQLSISEHRARGFVVLPTHTQLPLVTGARCECVPRHHTARHDLLPTPAPADPHLGGGHEGPAARTGSRVRGFLPSQGPLRPSGSGPWVGALSLQLSDSRAKHSYEKQGRRGQTAGRHLLTRRPSSAWLSLIGVSAV